MSCSFGLSLKLFLVWVCRREGLGEINIYIYIFGVISSWYRSMKISLAMYDGSYHIYEFWWICAIGSCGCWSDFLLWFFLLVAWETYQIGYGGLWLSGGGTVVNLCTVANLWGLQGQWVWGRRKVVFGYWDIS